jgi:hypothetical protein
MKRLIVTLGALVLWPLLTAGSCATTGGAEPRIEIREVRVPVPVPCLKADPGPLPAYPDTTEALAAAPDVFERFKLIWAARALRIPDQQADRAQLRACAGMLAPAEGPPPDPG